MVRGFTFAMCAAHCAAADLWMSGLTFATGNIGGGKPQPEFLGGIWEERGGDGGGEGKAFGDFEKHLGATVMSMGFGCPPWQGKLKQFNDRYGKTANGLCHQYKGNTSKKETAQAILGVETLRDFEKKTPGKMNPAFEDTTSIVLQGWLQGEFDNKKTISGAEGAMKERAAYPYFGKGFMELVNVKSEKERSEKYLEGMNFDPVNIGDDGAQWPYVMLWDLFIVHQFKNFYGDTTPTANRVLSDDVVACKVRRIAEHAWDTNDIFFVQELKTTSTLCKPEEGPRKCLVAEGKEADTGIFFNGDLNVHIDVGQTNVVEREFGEKINRLYDEMDAAKNSDKIQYYKYINYKDFTKDFKAEFLKQEEDKTFKMKDKFKKFTKKPKYTFAVGSVRKGSQDPVKVMLMSAHPDSDGMFCRLYLAIAKDVFVHKRGSMGLEKLIIGMDTNIQEKDYYDFNAQIEKTLGYTVLWPPDDTVYKQRTFLQSQIAKAAKFDKIKKDVLFFYPPDDQHQRWHVGVYNDLDTSSTFGGITRPGYSPGYHPKDGWPMDHFITYAAPPTVKKVTRIDASCFEANRAQTTAEAKINTSKKASSTQKDFFKNWRVRSNRGQGAHSKQKLFQKRMFKFVKKMLGSLGTSGTSK